MVAAAVAVYNGRTFELLSGDCQNFMIRWKPSGTFKGLQSNFVRLKQRRYEEYVEIREILDGKTYKCPNTTYIRNRRIHQPKSQRKRRRIHVERKERHIGVQKEETDTRQHALDFLDTIELTPPPCAAQSSDIVSILNNINKYI